MGNVTSGVAARFAFFPPDPPSYDVYRDQGKFFLSGVAPDKNMDVHMLETKGGNKIVAAFWRHPVAKFTILYSHGNAADLGQMMELFFELRTHLRVNIMWYMWMKFNCSISWAFLMEFLLLLFPVHFSSNVSPFLFRSIVSLCRRSPFTRLLSFFSFSSDPFPLICLKTVDGLNLSFPSFP